MAKAAQKKQDSRPKSQSKSPTGPPPGKPRLDLGKELINWSVTPLLLEKRKGIIFALATLAFSGLVWYSSSLVYGLVALAVSLGASAGFALPSTYRLFENGIEMHTAASSTIRKWLVFKDYRLADDGVQLVYYPRTLRDRASRGLFMYFGNVDRQRVKSIIADHVEKPDIPGSNVTN